MRRPLDPQDKARLRSVLAKFGLPDVAADDVETLKAHLVRLADERGRHRGASPRVQK